MAAVWPMAAGVLLLGLLRAWAEGHGGMLANRAARAQLSSLRARVAQSLAQTSPLTKPTGLRQAASAMAEQAEAIVPWLARYQSAMWRVRLLPLVILAAVALQSWVAALILMVAAPLIPLFMAIVGWRAKAASEEQMLQLGHMNAFLLDRLRGLSTLRALHAVELTGQRLRDHAEDLRTRTMRVLRIAFLSSAVLELFSALGVAMVAVYIGFHLLGTLNFGAWGGKLGLGQAMFVLLLAPAFFEPLRDLSAVWHDRAAGEAALQTLQSMQTQSVQIAGAQHVVDPVLPVKAALSPVRPVSVCITDLEVQAPGSDSRLAPVFADRGWRACGAVESQRQRQVRAAGADCRPFAGAARPYRGRSASARCPQQRSCASAWPGWVSSPMSLPARPRAISRWGAAL
jgi:ATP-binding cassette subfamily C protein CydD